jgi:hypothetical protein
MTLKCIFFIVSFNRQFDSGYCLCFDAIYDGNQFGQFGLRSVSFVPNLVLHSRFLVHSLYTHVPLTK